MNYFSQIEKIGFIRLKILMKPVSVGYTPQKWGSSAIRGALGNAMLRRFCPQQNFSCDICETQCSAAILFTTANPDKSEQAVNPYIIDYNEIIAENGDISFNITFFAKGLSAVDDVILALKDGIILGNDNHFQLIEIVDAATNELLFDGFLLKKAEIHYLNIDFTTADRYCIEFLTPYRAKIHIDEFGFPQLIRAMLRRTSTILRQIGIEPDFNYKDLIEKSEKIKTDYRFFNNESRTRYSSRSNTRWDVTGFTGIMIVSGDFSDFLPLMRISEIIGVGKLCVMGHGKIRISALI